MDFKKIADAIFKNTDNSLSADEATFAALLDKLYDLNSKNDKVASLRIDLEKKAETSSYGVHLFKKPKGSANPAHRITNELFKLKITLVHAPTSGDEAAAVRELTKLVCILHKEPGPLVFQNGKNGLLLQLSALADGKDPAEHHGSEAVDHKRLRMDPGYGSSSTLASSSSFGSQASLENSPPRKRKVPAKAQSCSIESMGEILTLFEELDQKIQDYLRSDYPNYFNKEQAKKIRRQLARSLESKEGLRSETPNEVTLRAKVFVESMKEYEEFVRGDPSINFIYSKIKLHVEDE